MEVECSIDKYEQHVDLMNECRAFYLSRLQKMDHYREVFSSTETDTKSSLASSIHRLQTEIVSLLDQDLALMKQLLTLNENIEDMKNRQSRGYSKESFGSSVFMLYSRYNSDSDVHHLPTVQSECELEHTNEDNTIFDDIQTYVQEDIYGPDDDENNFNSRFVL